MPTRRTAVGIRCAKRRTEEAKMGERSALSSAVLSPCSAGPGFGGRLVVVGGGGGWREPGPPIKGESFVLAGYF